MDASWPSLLIKNRGLKKNKSGKETEDFFMAILQFKQLRF
jgi:hypothetical protein